MFIRSLLLLISLFCFSSEIMANKPKRFSVSAPQGFGKAPQIEVYSKNGEKYTDVDKTDQSKFLLDINIECKYEGKGNKAYRGSMNVPGYTAVSDNEPPGFLIPHANEAYRIFRYDDGKGQPNNVVGICNNELQKRLSQNAHKTKYHIMATGFKVQYPAAIKVEYTLRCNATGIGKSSFDVKRRMINATIDCNASDLAKAKIPKPKPKPSPKRKKSSPARAKALIKNISFVAKPKIQTGKCPAYVGFIGHIEASRKGKVSYRYIKQDGTSSPKFEVVFNKAGVKKLRKWGLTVDRPKASKQFKSKAGKQSQYGEEGYYQLVIDSPKGVKKTTAKYKVDCDKAEMFKSS